MINKERVFMVITSIFIVLCVIVIVFMFKKDKRDNVTNIKEKNIVSDIVIEIDKKFERNKNNETGRIIIEEYYRTGVNNDLEVKIENQNGKEMQSQTKELKTQEETLGSEILVTQLQIDFKMPKDTFYIKCTVTKGKDTIDFIVDYRDFIER